MPNGARLEKLTIENFAGIRHLEMDVSPFTVLIGPQSVGKSITAKVLYFFKSLPFTLYRAAERDEVASCEEVVRKEFEELFFPQGFVEGISTLRWTRNSEFTVQIVGSSVSVPDSLRNAYDLLTQANPESEFMQIEGEEVRLVQSKFRSEQAYWRAADEVIPKGRHGAYFIPAGRSFYAQIERDAASFFTSAYIDPFVGRFGKLLARIKNLGPSSLPPASAGAAAQLVEELLGGTYTREGNEDLILSLDGRRLRSTVWSSGQQEAHPLALMLQEHCGGLLSPGNIFIEEPEAHLFPTSQRVITELIALAFNARSAETNVFLTTHSPYILTTMNNLLEAGLLYAEGLPEAKLDALSEIIPRDRALAPGSVGVFYMDRDSCRSIMDEETGLIGTSEIDEASGALSDQFEALLETERT